MAADADHSSPRSPAVGSRRCQGDVLVKAPFPPHDRFTHTPALETSREAEAGAPGELSNPRERSRPLVGLCVLICNRCLPPESAALKRQDLSSKVYEGKPSATLTLLTRVCLVDVVREMSGNRRLATRLSECLAGQERRLARGTGGQPSLRQHLGAGRKRPRPYLHPPRRHEATS